MRACSSVQIIGGDWSTAEGSPSGVLFLRGIYGQFIVGKMAAVVVVQVESGTSTIAGKAATAIAARLSADW